MKARSFTAIKNTLYIIYISIAAFFLMNDYKITTLVMMTILAPTIMLMEHYESTKAKS